MPPLRGSGFWSAAGAIHIPLLRSGVFTNRLSVLSFPPEEVDGDAGGEDGEAEGAVEGVVVEGRGDDERAGGGEERGGEGVAGDAEARAFALVSPAEDEERERRQPEPDEVHRD